MKLPLLIAIVWGVFCLVFFFETDPGYITQAELELTL
jgi:amino acid permease